MKHLKHLIHPLAALALSACELETSGNGDLDGFWHLERVDTLATGGVADYSSQSKFWAFQAKLLNVSDNNGGYLLRFSHEGDSLFLSEPYTNDRTNGDTRLEDAQPLRPYGINTLSDRFRIERMKGGDMVLRTKQLKLTLKKF